MRVVRFTETVDLNDSDGYAYSLDKNIDYVVPDSVPSSMIDNGFEKLIIRNSDFTTIIDSKLYRGEDLTNKSLITFRHGGIGDLIFQMPGIRELQNKYENVNITICCGNKYQSIFYGQEWNILSMPLKLSDIMNMDYIVFFEGLIENNPRAEEINAYDLHNEKFFVTPENSCPELYVNPEIEKEVIGKMIKNDYKNVVISFSSTVFIRAVPPKFWFDFVTNLSDKKINFYFVGTKRQNDEMQKLIDNIKLTEGMVCNVINWTADEEVLKELQYTMALIKNCDLVISPDSGLLHLAGGLGIPMVGLFSAFHSDLRLKYYKNTIGLNAKTSCGLGRGATNRCFQHGDGSCKLGRKLMELYSPCMNFVQVEHLLNVLPKFKII